jgi:guanylate kinase
MGFPIIITAPSGTGKTTLREKLLTSVDRLKYSISATTRKPRKEEKEGEDYYFLSKEEFNKWIREEKLCEWVYVYNEMYGTPREPLEKYLSQGYNVLLDLDIQGAIKMKEKYKEAVTIFIMPPSKDELRRRMKKREGRIGKKEEMRLKEAENEIKKAKEFEYLVVNTKLKETVKKITAIIIAEECKTVRCYGRERR